VYGFLDIQSIGSQDGNILFFVAFEISGLLGIVMVLLSVSAEHFSVFGYFYFFGKRFLGFHLWHIV
jgi:hypothetical protein